MKENETLSVSFFATGSKDGFELLQQFCKMAESEFGLCVREYSQFPRQNSDLAPMNCTQPTQVDFNLSCVNDDIVIFDATREEDGLHNYTIATEQPKSMDHVLVVSRNYLPINFFGVYEGGAPVYPNSHSNEVIIEWLRKQLAYILSSSPVPKQVKFTFENLGDDYAKCNLMLMESSNERSHNRNLEEGQIFISYRGNNYNQVKELKERIEVGYYHNGTKKKVRMLATGELAYDNELLTAQRRWGVLSIIDRIIFPVTELWIYKTDDYLNSWWTCGELITLFYSCKSVDSPSIKLRIFDPITDTITDEIPDIYRLTINEEQIGKMARLYSNCDPFQMGPELLEQFKIIRTLINLISGETVSELLTEMFNNEFLFKDTLEKFCQYSPGISLEDILMRYNDPIFLTNYFNDPVFSEEFWECPLLQCKVSSNNRNIDIDGFLSMKRPFHIQLQPEQLKNETIVCPKPSDCPDKSCKAKYGIIKADSRYLWLATRMGNINGTGLKELITYRAEYKEQ